MSNFSQKLNRSSVYVAPLQIFKSQECLPGEVASEKPESEVLQNTQIAIARTINEMTPPPTPLRLTDSPMSHKRNAFQPDFHNFLRAFYPFHPATSGTSSTITLPLNEGDVILVHSIHTNGWADGTLLTSGARGWLPTNYCEAYDHQAMRNLLKALLNFWDLLRGDLTATMECFANQEYMKGIIAGVRCLLDDSRCLTRDAPMVTENYGLRKNRKALLSDLSSLVRTARRLQDETVNSTSMNEVEDIIYEITLKAFKVVTRAVRFLDVWSDVCTYNNSLAVSEDAKDQYRPDIYQAKMDVPPTPPADSTTFGQAISMDAHFSAERGSPATVTPNQDLPAEPQHDAMQHSAFDPSHSSANTNNQPVQTETTSTKHDRFPLSQSRSSACTPPSFVRPTTSRSSQSFPQNSSRPHSRQQKHRQSATHRISASGHATAACKANLASSRLSAAHDAFLSHQGSFIGRLHLQSRSMSELLLTTQQSVTACRDLLSVVEEVWDRDFRRSDSLEVAKDTMYARITDLVQTTREIFHSTVSRDEAEDVVVPEHDRDLMSAATECVKAAGECVAQTKFVLERIGDFEFEPFGLGIFEAAEAASTGESKDASTADATPSDLAAQFPQPPAEMTGVISSDLTNQFLEPPTQTVDSIPSEWTTQFPQPPSAAVTEQFPLPSTELTIHFPQSPQYPNPESQPTMDMADDMVRPEMPRAVSSQTVKGASPLIVADLNVSTALLTPLPDSPIDAQDSCLPSSFAQIEGASSSWNFPSDSWSHDRDSASFAANNVLRDSETSAVSQTSTRATTPELSHSKKSDPSLNSGLLSLSGSQTTLSDACDDAEASLLEKTYAHELTYNKTGQITGGTLPALIERMTTHSSTPDSTFVSTFYLTFRLFTTPVQFAEALVDRFRYVGESSHVAGPVRLRVYNVFKGWMESHWRADCDNVALPIILDFAAGELAQALPAAGARLAALGEKVSSVEGPLVPRLISSIGKTNTSIAQYISPDTPLPAPILSKGQMHALKGWKPAGGRLSILDFDPLELARQFTIKESKIFCSILPEELLAMEWTKKSDSKAVNVRAMSTLSTDLATLVADTILNLDAKKRAAIIKQWVKIAKKSLQLNNYDSLMAIICALNSSTILRLKKTWDIVSPKTKATLEELRSIVEVTRNYAVLRQRLQNHVPPCLPFVGTYLTDLTFIEAGNQQTRHLSGNCGDRGMAVINFDKHQKTAKVIGELQRFQIPYRLTPVPELQEWMDAEISRVRLSDEASLQSYYRRSLLLEPRECALTRPSPTDSANSSFSGSSIRGNFDFLPWGNKDRLMSASN